MADPEQVDQIKTDVAALQHASAAAAEQIAVLTDQVLALQAGDVTDEQIENLHNALADVTSELVMAVEESQEALGGTGDSSEGSHLADDLGPEPGVV